MQFASFLGKYRGLKTVFPTTNLNMLLQVLLFISFGAYDKQFVSKLNSLIYFC